MTKTTRERYTLGFKQEAVKLAESGSRIAAAAGMLDVVEQTAVVQPDPAALNAGLRQSGALRARLA